MTFDLQIIRIISFAFWVMSLPLPGYVCSGGCGHQGPFRGYECFLEGFFSIIGIGVNGVNGPLRFVGWISNFSLFVFWWLSREKASTPLKILCLWAYASLALAMPAMFVNDLGGTGPTMSVHPSLGAFVWLTSFIVPTIGVTLWRPKAD